MRRIATLFLLITLATGCVSSFPGHHPPTAAELANCQCWNQLGTETATYGAINRCTGRANWSCDSIPPPDAGQPCGTYWARTDAPEGSAWSRAVWRVNGHYTQRVSQGVCR